MIYKDRKGNEYGVMKGLSTPPRYKVGRRKPGKSWHAVNSRRTPWRETEMDAELDLVEYASITRNLKEAEGAGK